MTMMLESVVLLVGGILFVALVKMGIAVLRADRSEYRENQRRFSRWLDPLFGTYHRTLGERRDNRIRAGMVVNLRTNQWQEQGTLTDEAIDVALRPRRR